MRLLACLMLTLTAWLAAAQAPPIFRVRVDLVRVDASVMRGGLPVPGLGPADFEVRDNGVVQALESATLEQVAIDAFLVLDTSGSVAGLRLGHLKDAARAFLDGLRSIDRAALVTFSHEIRLSVPLTPAISAVRLSVGALEANGATAAHDALYVALRLREAQPGRGVVLLFSDGFDTISWLSPEDVTGAASRSDVVVYTVGLQETGYSGLQRAKVDTSRADWVERVADATGGRAWYAGSSAELRENFLKVLADLRTRYLLTYYPQGVSRDGWHTLDVRLKRGRATVRARPGYFAR